MEKTFVKTTPSFQSVKEEYYDELLALAGKLIPDSARATAIVSDNLERVKRGIDNYENIQEIKSTLYILILQDCDRYREYLRVGHEKAKDTHYNQLVFFLSYFVVKGKALLIAMKTFEQMKGSYFSYEEENCTEAYIKITAIKMCLTDMETDNPLI